MAAEDIVALIIQGIPTPRSKCRISPATATIGRRRSFRRLLPARPKIQQHQMVYQALGGRMGGVLHALKLTTMAPKG